MVAMLLVFYGCSPTCFVYSSSSSLFWLLCLSIRAAFHFSHPPLSTFCAAVITDRDTDGADECSVISSACFMHKLVCVFLTVAAL